MRRDVFGPPVALAYKAFLRLEGIPQFWDWREPCIGLIYEILYIEASDES